MKFKPGVSGNYKGRPKGSLNKNNYYNVQAKLIEMGHDPIEAVIALAKDPLADAALRFKANQELISKISPSIKAIEQRTENALTDGEIENIKHQMEELLAANKKDF